MRSFVCLAAVCLYTLLLSAAGELRTCKVSGRGWVHPFFPEQDEGDKWPREEYTVSLPCRYKLANIKCGKIRAVIHGENLVIKESKSVYGSTVGKHYTSGVSIDVMSKGDDDTVTTQTYRLGYERIVQLQKARSKESRWTTSGPAGRRSPRLTYSKSDRKGVFSLGKLTVEYAHPFDKILDYSGESWKINVKSYIRINCTAGKMKTYEDYPMVFCGKPDDNWRVRSRFANSIPWFKDNKDRQARAAQDYALLTVQNVNQTSDFCVDVVSTYKTCADDGKILYKCMNVYNTYIMAHYHYTDCLKDNGIDPMEMFATCLRAYCCKTNKNLSEKECNDIKTAANKCEIPQKEIRRYRPNMKFSELLAESQCNEDTE